VGRGVYGDWHGDNRFMNMGYRTSKERHVTRAYSPADPDILPGSQDVNAPDGPGGDAGKGFIWDAALRAGLTVRSYGCAVRRSYEWPLVPDPFAAKHRVAWPNKASLLDYTDPYFYAFNAAYPDYHRAKEWKREFDEFAATNSVPNLMVMWLPNDHF